MSSFWDATVSREVVMPHNKGVRILAPGSESLPTDATLWWSGPVTGHAHFARNGSLTLCVLTSEDFMVGGTYEDLQAFLSVLSETLTELRVAELQQTD
jgi:hypothetical protein